MASSQGCVPSRLTDLHGAAEYLGVSYWTVRDLVSAGEIPTVQPPAPTGRRGQRLRRVLLDIRDLDAVIERWKTQRGNATFAAGRSPVTLLKAAK
jgi:excisionase family DNA binding protein